MNTHLKLLGRMHCSPLCETGELGHNFAGQRTPIAVRQAVHSTAGKRTTMTQRDGPEDTADIAPTRSTAFVLWMRENVVARWCSIAGSCSESRVC